METFKEYYDKRILTEMPIAMIGDWFYEEVNYLSTIALDALDRDYIFLETFHFGKKMKFYQLKNKLVFVLGLEEMDDEYSSSGPQLRFTEVLKMTLKEQEKIGSKLHIKNLVEMKTVAILKEFSSRGIAKKMYIYLTKLGYSILSDSDQYLGARRLWTRLSSETKEISVDVIDLDKMEIIEKNVKIVHGKLDDEFDKRYWSSEKNEDGLSKYHIRFILRKIA